MRYRNQYSMDDFRAEMKRRGVPAKQKVRRSDVVHHSQRDKGRRLLHGPWINKFSGVVAIVLELEITEDLDIVHFAVGSSAALMKLTAREFLTFYERKNKL